MATKIQKLLFIDTNIWLDFYRSRNETGLALLKHVETVADKLIVSYQLESEFKRNRQVAILEGIQDLKAPGQVLRPGIFSDARASEALTRGLKEAEKRVKALKVKLTRALEEPSRYDPVYQACQRIFHKADALTLTREDKLRHLIRRKAFRRFLHGCPPRKKNDTVHRGFHQLGMDDSLCQRTQRRAGNCHQRLGLRTVLRGQVIHQ